MPPISYLLSQKGSKLHQCKLSFFYFTLFQSTSLLITTFATFGCMVLLAWFKYLIAYKVDSRALRTDGKIVQRISSPYWSQYVSYNTAWENLALDIKNMYQFSTLQGVPHLAN